MPVALMLATLTDRRDFSHDWLLERKSDGERCIARKLGGDVRLESRTGRDLAGTYPEAHQVGSGANRRNTSGTWTRHSYPLTPVLRCGRCGSTMHGEISSNNRRTAAYYACHAARRNRSATMPRGLKCDAGWIPASHLDTAIRDELQRCAPSDVMHAPYRQQLGRSLNRPHDPRALADAAIRRLDEQLARSRRLDGKSRR